MTSKGTQNPKAMASITMLVSWTVWNQRNAIVFRNKATPPPILLESIKNEPKLCVTAGAKPLGFVILGE